jgi:uncharacterized protein YabN with tetrapyrrole methylase and pyrophosphatase domain
MAEKQTKPETFDVSELYGRLDQALYDHREEEAKYERVITEEMAKRYESAINTAIEIGRMHPHPIPKEELHKVLDKMKKDGEIDESVHRIIMEHVY